MSLPVGMLSTENISSDVFHGCFVVTCTLFAFIGLVWLREQILHAGGPDWLERDNVQIPLVDNPPPANAQQPQRAQEEHAVPQQAQDNNNVPPFVDDPPIPQEGELRDEGIFIGYISDDTVMTFCSNRVTRRSTSCVPRSGGKCGRRPANR